MKLLDILTEDVDKKREKVKIVYSALKKGAIESDYGPKFLHYALPDEYTFEPIADVNGNPTIPACIVSYKDVKFYVEQVDGSLKELKWISDYYFINYTDKIKQKFRKFNIALYTSYND